MQPNEFVHLHLHTEYSTLDGINKIETLPEHIKNIGQKAVAITDHGNVAGTYEFYKSCNKVGVKPILGMEAYYTVNDRSAKERDEDGEKYYHLVLLAKNNTGLKNLYSISTKAYTEGMYFKPRADDALLAEHSEGLIATSACLGSRTSRLILSGRKDEAERLIDHHRAIFNNRFLIEIQLHADKDQQAVNQELIEIALRKKLPLVLTNDCHYTHENEKNIHEQALCLSTNARMSDPPWNPEAKGELEGKKTRFSFGDIDVHVARHEWMWNLAKQQNIPYDAIINTMHVADLIESNTYFVDKMNRYPSFTDLPEGITSWDALENLVKFNLSRKFNGMPPVEYRDRINYELKIIKKMGYYDYLLIVNQFISAFKEDSMLIGPGRGSAAGSLVAYALDITTIDPIKYGLVFERWLNYGRASKPKIFDVDMIDKINSATSTPHKCSHH